MRCLTNEFFLVLAFAVFCSAASGQDPASDAKASRQASPTPAEAPAADDNPRRGMTADEVLRELQGQREANVPVEPASSKTIRQAGYFSEFELLPEGYPVSSLVGSMKEEGRWWVLNFESDGAEVQSTSMKMLPCSQLEQMVASAQNTTEELTFLVHGEVTVFRGENFLLPTFVRIGSRAVEEEVEPPAAAEGEDEDASSTENNGADSEEASAEPGSVEDVLDAMKRARPSTRRVRSARPRPGDASEDVVLDASVLLRERQPISMRPGRIIEHGGWWRFVFESDHPDRPEPRMDVLPCLQLERMLEAMEGAAAGCVFVVSGEVTVYEGSNYLLPRVAHRRIDTGNLRK